jgi:hypothetical protein
MAALAAVILLVGCGGDEEGGSTPGADGPSPGGTNGTLDFEQVKTLTTDQLEDKAGLEECEELGWVEDKEQKRLLAPFKQTKRIELLACDGVPYLAYIEYGDASEAEKSLAAALLPYLVAGETTVVIPLAGIEEQVAADYLAALEAECACGEIVKPGAPSKLR